MVKVQRTAIAKHHVRVGVLDQSDRGLQYISTNFFEFVMRRTSCNRWGGVESF
ncbi:MAG: hypothetical protein OXO49_03145 [Gammaproteobacteria bacterium]|nr:hypothetical protein [Gammaproteobacteria bacterium]MDE0251975.1 hypothetical protein [Gammaproteobacteria bacterium]MDE0402917.1 hypothetical protein [Gammaproteobacteria bacterium]